MATKAHILAIPLPLQGHLNPMIQLCKRLLEQRIRVTLLTTVSTASALQPQEPCAAGPITVETVPDYILDDVENLDMYQVYLESFRASITRGVGGIIEKIQSSGVLPLRAVVYDSVIPWALDMAHGYGLRGAVLFTQSCAVSSFFYRIHHGSLEIDPSDENSEVSVLPGMPVLSFHDLPFDFSCANSYSSVLRLLTDQFSTFEKADWRLFNTFDELENEAIKWLGNQCPILTIGPTIPSMHLDKRIQDNRDYGLDLLKPDIDSCLNWLDTKEDHSVVYVSFGSLIRLGKDQMEEIAYGLLDSECHFLWVVKDPKEGSELPLELTSEPMEKGLIVKWCPQLDVLAHRAVGAFITHCGWNSTLEALSLGVPVVAMARMTDQRTNAKMVADVWRAGVRVEAGRDGSVTGLEVAGRVKEAMRGERGDEVRRNAMKWRDLAKEAVGEGGSSDRNVVKFATELELI